MEAADMVPYTQILYLSVPQEQELESSTSDTGLAWSKALDVVEQSQGFVRLSWGRSPEDRSKVQLHTVRTTLAQHQNFLYSAAYDHILQLIQPFLIPDTKPFARHAPLKHFTPERRSPLSPSTPVTGSAVYVSTDVTWHEGAWPLWTHIVRHVPGCIGIVGGELVEQVDGKSNCYLVYVGWESIKAHEDYHHTKHFASRRVVLGLGNDGYREYGHMVFEGERVKPGVKL
ncbi:uncharacterized protein HMPREF1541_10647 [Cyphellophora europaea CBS 101466]|uniref:ABM domain-containing protein n=1 Tax=Cyphellophora europaea (strain CBS 101466) TaxID=1220924 RepID=W2S5X7_CYPE1|nr:uncharacterized protein HMPREF1541_10647 [Cyphellophora europaea CBS 101466]ETN44097.1 hypothetical protein HMPREF1541_10647 [Cyphellophora europaea CBS 101466]